jgi:PAS domain S-box-containing protein
MKADSRWPGQTTSRLPDFRRGLSLPPRRPRIAFAKPVALLRWFDSTCRTQSTQSGHAAIWSRMNSLSPNVSFEALCNPTPPTLVSRTESNPSDGSQGDMSVTSTAERVLAAVNALHRQTLFLINSDLIIEWISEGVRSLLGRSPDSIVGTSAFTLIHPEDIETVAEVIAQDLAPGTQSRDLGHRPTMDVRVLHADGQWLTLSVHSTMRLDDENIRALIVQVYPRDQLRDSSYGRLGLEPKTIREQ